MKITITISVPESELTLKLMKDKLTREQFKKIMQESFLQEMVTNIDDLAPGAHATLEIE